MMELMDSKLRAFARGHGLEVVDIGHFLGAVWLHVKLPLLDVHGRVALDDSLPLSTPLTEVIDHELTLVKREMVSMVLFDAMKAVKPGLVRVDIGARCPTCLGDAAVIDIDRARRGYRCSANGVHELTPLTLVRKRSDVGFHLIEAS